jgi:nucleotide-binding universal stress UspA family protein
MGSPVLLITCALFQRGILRSAMSELSQTAEALSDDARSRAVDEKRGISDDISFEGHDCSGPPPVHRSLQSILVPTDFSVSSEKTIHFAADLAAQCGARLTVMHVVDINSRQASAHAGSAESLMGRLWQEGVARMTGLADRLARQEIPAETILVEGLPWEQICNYSQGFDLTVLTRTPARRRRSFFSRHTARRCIENLACPVLEV